MPIEKPISPRLFRHILELEGYKVVKQDEFNWAFFKDGSSMIHPIIVPHDVELVPVDVMSSTLDALKISPGAYADLLAQARTSDQRDPG